MRGGEDVAILPHLGRSYRPSCQWKFLLFKNLLIKYTAYAILIVRLLCKIARLMLMERDF